jgi:hypothetical protein
MINKSLLLAAVGALLLTSSALALAAETKSTKHTPVFASTTFSAPVKLTGSELAELTRTAIPVMPQQNLYPSLYQPEAVSTNWSYTGLYPGSYITTNESYTVTADNEQVIIKAVQYPDGIITSGKTAQATYQLIPVSGGVATTAYRVDGNYISQNVSFSFYNVAKGTYKLRIVNVTSGSNACDMAGNGFVYYY